jgi:dTDP-4-amino-4,6-dideoxygalactose transaminase
MHARSVRYHAERPTIRSRARKESGVERQVCEAPIPYVALKQQFAEEREDLMPRIERVLASGTWIGGNVVEAFEKEVAAFCEVDHAVALASGTDALVLGLRALGIGPGDEVITPPNSFIASTAAIVHVGATPIFADVRDDQLIDPEMVIRALSPRTKAIMPVHLSGRVCDMDILLAIARDRELFVIEDAAQAIGSRYNGRRAGTLGHIGCFSAHPLKNLNAVGDAGFLTTSDAKVAERIRWLRAHGLVDRNTAVEWGGVSRLDPIQAEILRFRLERLPTVIGRRRINAARYREVLRDIPVFMPPEPKNQLHTYHTFVVQVDERDALREFLAERQIETAIHYPIPIHLQPAAKALGFARGAFPMTERQAERIVSLPVHQYLGIDGVERVADAIAEFYE